MKISDGIQYTQVNFNFPLSRICKIYGEENQIEQLVVIEEYVNDLYDIVDALELPRNIIECGDSIAIADFKESAIDVFITDNYMSLICILSSI